MDASILRALMAKVLKNEEELKIQTYLEQARDAVSNMASSPQDLSFQTAFADAFKQLKSSISRMEDQLTPGDWDRLGEISSESDFSVNLIEEIENLVNENSATPVVIRDGLISIAEKRNGELDHYKTLLKELGYFDFSAEQNDINQGQIGFKVPRELFDNNLVGLIEELKFLRRFIRLVAETEGGDPEEIEVGTISTSDPVFWLVVAYGVAKSIGNVTDWCLNTWKKVEDIRNVRTQTAQLKSFNATEVDKIFGPKIEQQIAAAIEEIIVEITAKLADKARKNELQNGLRPVLRQFLARVERGLTVDVQYLLPPESDEEDGEVSEDKEARRAEIRTVASKLVFPRPVGEPVLKILAVNDDTVASAPTKPK